jgi:hypothetical protein
LSTPLFLVIVVTAVMAFLHGALKGDQWEVAELANSAQIASVKHREVLVSMPVEAERFLIRALSTQRITSNLRFRPTDGRR